MPTTTISTTTTTTTTTLQTTALPLTTTAEPMGESQKFSFSYIKNNKTLPATTTVAASPSTVSSTSSDQCKYWLT